MPGEEMPGGVTVFAAGQGGCQRVEVGGGRGGVGGQTALGGVTGSLIGGLEILLDLDLILMAIKGFGTRNGETRHDMIKTVF